MISLKDWETRFTDQDSVIFVKKNGLLNFNIATNFN